jgi:predicted GNAT superfamily acetyltransferase
MNIHEQGDFTPERENAKMVFNPSRIGLKDLISEKKIGWGKDIPGIGPVTFAPLTAAHRKVPGISDTLTHMQKEIFGIDNPNDILPPHLLGIPHYLVAYKSGQFTKEGCVGFAVAFGGKENNRTLESKAVGVMPEYQGASDIGWYLRMTQAHIALENGFDKIEWSFNPIRGRTARLFLAKLGGEGTTFTPKKAGLLDSSKGTPSHKVTVRWNLTSSNVQSRLKDVYASIDQGSTYDGPSLLDYPDTPFVNLNNLDSLEEQKPPKILYELPPEETLIPTNGMIESDAEQELGTVLNRLIDTDDADVDDAVETDPAAVIPRKTHGDYVISDLITAKSMGRKINYYLFSHK